MCSNPKLKKSWQGARVINTNVSYLLLWDKILTGVNIIIIIIILDFGMLVEYSIHSTTPGIEHLHEVSQFKPRSEQAAFVVKSEGKTKDR